MTKEELSEQFTNEVIEKIKPLINETFLKGYELGALQTASTVKVDDVTYYDLGLPSGTLWSDPITFDSNSYRMLCHSDALKLNIPTREQCEELLDYCKLNPLRDWGSFLIKGVEIIGFNGKRLNLRCYNHYRDLGRRDDYIGEGINNNYENKFWIKGKPDSDNYAPVLWANIQHCKCSYDKFHYTGFKLPVILVKSKSEI